MATFLDGTAEEPIVTTIVRNKLIANTVGTCGLAPNSDFGRITTERCNIFLHPVKGEALISHTWKIAISVEQTNKAVRLAHIGTVPCD